MKKNIETEIHGCVGEQLDTGVKNGMENIEWERSLKERYMNGVTERKQRARMKR